MLLSGLGRIRDVAVGPDGLVYPLLERQTGSRVLRLVPAKLHPTICRNVSAMRETLTRAIHMTGSC
jgi:hypothetical protein